MNVMRGTVLALRNRERRAQNPDAGRKRGCWEAGESPAERRRPGLMAAGRWKAGLAADRAAVDEVGQYGLREDRDHRC